MALDGLEGKTHLHIVFDIDVVEPEAYATQQRAFPPLITGDDPIVDLLDFLRGEPGTDSFYYVLVVALAVETTVDSVIVNTRQECCVVIVNDCEVLCLVVLEDY